MNNDKYTSLAHEHATLSAIVRMAKDKFLPMEGTDEPEIPIESEHLPRGSCVVPEDTIIDVIMRLQRLANDRESEMKKFNFVKTENPYEQAWEKERAEKQSQQSPQPPSGQGKSKGRKGGSKTPGPAVRGQ